MITELRTHIPGALRRSKSSLMLVEELFFDLTTPALTIPTLNHQPEFTVPLVKDQAVQVNPQDLDYLNPQSSTTTTGTSCAVETVRSEYSVNSFHIDERRRTELDTLIDLIERRPSNFSFAFTYDEFYNNMMKMLNERDMLTTVKSAGPFMAFWAYSENRKMILNEFKYAIGKTLCQGRMLSSLPIRMCNSCIDVYKKMIR